MHPDQNNNGTAVAHVIKCLTTAAVPRPETLRVDFYLGDQTPDSEQVNEGLACSVLINAKDHPSHLEVRRRALERAHKMLLDFIQRCPSQKLNLGADHADLVPSRARG